MGQAIKGAAKAAVPHLNEADVATVSNLLESGIDKISNKSGKQVFEVGKRAFQDFVNIDHPPHKRRVKGL